MFKNVLVPVDIEADRSPGEMLEAVDHLADDGALVRYLYVVHSTPALVSQFLPADFEQNSAAECLDKLKAAVQSKDLGNRTTDFVIRHGDVYREILQVAEQEKTDLIVLASHKPGVEDYLLGSNAARVVRHAVCTVMVLR